MAACGRRSFLCRYRVFTLLLVCVFGLCAIFLADLCSDTLSRVVRGGQELSPEARGATAVNDIGRSTPAQLSVPEYGSDLNCTPKEHILFLKTHKTGGSTVTNILNRFGDKRNLAFALPSPPNHYKFGWPKPFDTSYVDRKLLPQGYPDILCNHALFNQKPMKAVMPPDTSFITILRDPLENFPSAFEYMDVAYVNKMKGRTTSQNIDTFFHKINDYFVTYYKKVGTVSYLLRNGQFFDLGHRIQRVRTQNQVYPYIKEFERIFDHVLITEYFDESLILMKREFCWELEDVLYFKFLERTSGETQLSATAEEKIRLWSHADVILYEHFKDRLLQEILKQGQDFYDEVEQLREFNKKMKEKCIGEEQLEKAPGSRSSKVRKFVLRQDLSHESKVECCRMIRSENDYVDYHRTKQGASGKNRLNPLVGCE